MLVQLEQQMDNWKPILCLICSNNQVITSIFLNFSHLKKDLFGFLLVNFLEYDLLSQEGKILETPMLHDYFELHVPLTPVIAASRWPNVLEVSPSAAPPVPDAITLEEVISVL
jgi:hypothetical protein